MKQLPRHRIAVLVVWFAAWSAACAGRLPPRAQAGTLDLRGWNLETDGPVSVDGDWDFYWRQWLDPSGLEPPVSSPAPAVMPVPSGWDGRSVGDAPLPGVGFASYRLRVRLAKPGQISIAIPWMATAYRMYANGSLVAENGVVGDRPDVSRPQFRPSVATLLAEGPTLVIVVHVSNFHFRSGGIWNRLVLGPSNQIADLLARRLAAEMILLGAILIMGFYHLGLFRLRREDRSSLWFGAFCLVIAVKFLVSEELLLTRVWPDFPWDLLLRIEYLSNALSVPVFYAFLAALYPAELARLMLRAAGIAGGGFALVILLGPVRLSSWLTPRYEPLIALFTLYAVIVFIRAARRRRTGAALLLFGGGVFLLSVLHDLLSYRQIVLTPRLMPAGFFIMVLTQSGVLAQRFSEAFRRESLLARENTRLVDELRGRMDELQHTRRLLAGREEGLRKQIAEMLHGRVQTRLLVVWHWLEQAVRLIDGRAKEARELVMTARDEVQRVQEEDVRRASHLLHPSIIDVGLVPAVRSLADRFGDALQVSLEVDPSLARVDAAIEGGIPPPVRLAGYRVLEEALGNVLAPAGAQRVRVGLGLDGAGSITLAVEDDGRGFDPARSPHGLGLRTIANRVADLGGRWTLTGVPGRGALFLATLPLSPP